MGLLLLPISVLATLKLKAFPDAACSQRRRESLAEDAELAVDTQPLCVLNYAFSLCSQWFLLLRNNKLRSIVYGCKSRKRGFSGSMVFELFRKSLGLALLPISVLATLKLKAFPDAACSQRRRGAKSLSRSSQLKMKASYRLSRQLDLLIFRRSDKWTNQMPIPQ